HSLFYCAGRVHVCNTPAMQPGVSAFHNSCLFLKLGGSTDQNLFYGSLLAVGHTVNTGTIRVEVGTLALAGTPASPVENQGSITARAAPDQPKTTLWLLNGLDSTGSIDADRVRFHTAGPVVFSIAG